MVRSRATAGLLLGSMVMAVSLGACWIGGPAESRITVHNRTETPIVFASYRADHYVAACSTSVLTWHGDWASDRPENVVIPDAVRIGPITYGPFESNVEYWYVVLATGRQQFYRASDVPNPLPACSGTYVEPTPVPPPTPRPTKAPVEYPLEVVGVVTNVVTDNRGTTYTLEDGTTIVATPNRRYVGGRHPEVGDLFLGGARPELWIDRAAPGQAQPGGKPCYRLVGDALSVGDHVLVGRSIISGPALIIVEKAADWADPTYVGSDGRLPGIETCLDAEGRAFTNR